MGYYTYIDEHIAILNIPDQPKNPFLTLTTTHTGKLIDNAHLNNKPPNPNTLLHNWSIKAPIMAKNNRRN